MTATMRVWLGSTGVVAAVLAYPLLRAVPEYVPNQALADAASGAPGPMQASAAIVAELRRCMSSGGLDDGWFARRAMTVRSFENDAGFLATTRIDCTSGACRIEATALLPHRGVPVRCAGRHRGRYGREGGMWGWFPDDVDPNRRILSPPGGD